MKAMQTILVLCEKVNTAKLQRKKSSKEKLNYIRRIP